MTRTELRRIAFGRPPPKISIRTFFICLVLMGGFFWWGITAKMNEKPAPEPPRKPLTWQQIIKLLEDHRKRTR